MDNGNDDSRSESLVAELDSLASRIDEEIEHLQMRKIQVDAKLRRLQAIRQVMQPGEAPARRKPNRKARQPSFPRMAELARTIRDYGDGNGRLFSAAELRGRMLRPPKRDSTICRALEQLRTQGAVGWAGQVPGTGDRTRLMWRVLDHERLAEIADGS